MIGLQQSSHWCRIRKSRLTRLGHPNLAFVGVVLPAGPCVATRCMVRLRVSSVGPSGRSGLAESVVQHFAGMIEVESSEGLAKRTSQHDIGAIVALRTDCIRGDIGAMRDIPS